MKKVSHSVQKKNDTLHLVGWLLQIVRVSFSPCTVNPRLRKIKIGEWASVIHLC